MTKYTEKSYTGGVSKALTAYGLKSKEQSTTRVGWKEEQRPPQKLSTAPKMV
jgi:hypothetical protein